MPLRGTTEDRFHEFRHGKMYSKTKRRHGRKVANRQMVAAVLRSKRRDSRKRSR